MCSHHLIKLVIANVHQKIYIFRAFFRVRSPLFLSLSLKCALFHSYELFVCVFCGPFFFVRSSCSFRSPFVVPLAIELDVWNINLQRTIIQFAYLSIQLTFREWENVSFVRSHTWIADRSNTEKRNAHTQRPKRGNVKKSCHEEWSSMQKEPTYVACNGIFWSIPFWLWPLFCTRTIRFTVGFLWLF